MTTYWEDVKTPQWYLEPPDPPEEDYPEIEEILVSDRLGIYIPKEFCENYPINNADPEDWECCLKGPDWEVNEINPNLSFVEKLFNSWKDYLQYGEWDWECPANMRNYVQYNEWYWESWNSIIDKWEHVERCKKFILWQDGDLFLIRHPDQTEKGDY